METTETNKSTPNQGVTQPSSQQVKKTNWTKIGIIALIIAAIALFIVIILIAIKPSISGFFVKQQTIEIYNLTYSLELENGTIISQETENFEKGMVASSLGFLTNKLDKELTNLSKGETRTIVLEAKDAFGEYDYSKVFNYERIKKENRTIEINRTNWIAINDFKETFGEEPKPNKTYELEGAPWPYKVIEKNETHVKISQEPSLNQEIPFGFFVYKVIEITELKIKLKVFGNETVIPTRNGNIEIKLTENEIIYTLTPEIGKEVSLEDLPKARVTGMNSTHLLLDANHPYAGQKVIVKITLIEKKTAKKENGITGFVTCLERAGFRIYGANWCGWTRKLVDEFGGFDVVKPIYIECTEQQRLCNEKGIRGYPTILIKDKPYIGERTFEGFEKATGCKAPRQRPASSNVSIGSC